MSSRRGKTLVSFSFKKLCRIIRGPLLPEPHNDYPRIQRVADEALIAFRKARQEMHRDQKNLFFYGQFSICLPWMDAREVI